MVLESLHIVLVSMVPLAALQQIKAVRILAIELCVTAVTITACDLRNLFLVQLRKILAQIFCFLVCDVSFFYVFQCDSLL